MPAGISQEKNADASGRARGEAGDVVTQTPARTAAAAEPRNDAKINDGGQRGWREGTAPKKRPNSASIRHAPGASVLIESELKLQLFVLTRFFRRTGFHFARKRS